MLTTNEINQLKKNIELKREDFRNRPDYPRLLIDAMYQQINLKPVTGKDYTEDNKGYGANIELMGLLAEFIEVYNTDFPNSDKIKQSIENSIDSFLDNQLLDVHLSNLEVNNDESFLILPLRAGAVVFTFPVISHTYSMIIKKFPKSYHLEIVDKSLIIQEALKINNRFLDLPEKIKDIYGINNFYIDIEDNLENKNTLYNFIVRDKDLSRMREAVKQTGGGEFNNLKQLTAIGKVSQGDVLSAVSVGNNCYIKELTAGFKNAVLPKTRLNGINILDDKPIYSLSSKAFSNQSFNYTLIQLAKRHLIANNYFLPKENPLDLGFETYATLKEIRSIYDISENKATEKLEFLKDTNSVRQTARDMKFKDLDTIKHIIKDYPLMISKMYPSVTTELYSEGLRLEDIGPLKKAEFPSFILDKTKKYSDLHRKAHFDFKEKYIGMKKMLTDKYVKNQVFEKENIQENLVVNRALAINEVLYEQIDSMFQKKLRDISKRIETCIIQGIEKENEFTKKMKELEPLIKKQVTLNNAMIKLPFYHKDKVQKLTKRIDFLKEEANKATSEYMKANSSTSECFKLEEKIKAARQNIMGDSKSVRSVISSRNDRSF